MNMTEKMRQRAEASSLSRTGSMILKGQSLFVNWLPDNSSDLGYTAGKQKSVYVAWKHSYMKNMTDSEKTLFRMGIFAHELLHQVLTNFSYTDALMAGMTNIEASIFMNFANTLEDPAIEFFAPKIFGGKLLNSLRYSIQVIYNHSTNIENETTPFSQMIKALIQFGDMGLVKGEFTFPEAYKYFCLLAPKYNEGIECPDSKRRLDIAKECMELSRPLWEEEVKRQMDFEKFMNDLLNSVASAMQDAGLDREQLSELLNELMEDGSSDSEDEDNNKSPSQSRRNSFVKELKEKEGNEENNDADESTCSGTSNENEQDDDSETPSDVNKSNNSNDESDSLDDNVQNDKAADIDKNNNINKDDNETQDEKGPSKSSTQVCNSSITKSSEECEKIVNEEFVLDENIIANIENELRREIKRIEDDEKANERDFEVPDFVIDSSLFKNASCLNQQIKSNTNLLGLYNSLISEYKNEITFLTNALKRLFQQDETENLRYSSGRYNIKRGALHTTAKIFDKRRDHGKIDDIAIEILVDQSGSMNGSKIKQAQTACIIIAETCAKLNIPCYVLGFSSGKRGYDAIHDHYVSWKNTALQRSSLLSMIANGCNFDGYSIRYAGENLKRKSATHKILFVISDGQPACSKYNSETGILDTMNAIKEVRKNAIVFGLAIGRNCGPTVLQSMYGKDFIHVSNESSLSFELANKLKTIVKSFKY